MTEKTESFAIILMWIISIVIVVVALYRFQKTVSQEAEDKIKLEEDKIEKEVENASINQLVDDNNKSRKS